MSDKFLIWTSQQRKFLRKLPIPLKNLTLTEFQDLNCFLILLTQKMSTEASKMTLNSVSESTMQDIKAFYGTTGSSAQIQRTFKGSKENKKRIALRMVKDQIEVITMAGLAIHIVVKECHDSFREYSEWEPYVTGGDTSITMKMTDNNSILGHQAMLWHKYFNKEIEDSETKQWRERIDEYVKASIAPKTDNFKEMFSGMYII